MKTSQIKFLVTLDKDKIPEKITWNAEDSMGNEFSETKSISLALWDHEKMNTLKIDLWTKDMRVDEMKYFFYQTLLLMSDNLERATNEKEMADSLRDFCKYFSDKMLKS